MKVAEQAKMLSDLMGIAPKPQSVPGQPQGAPIDEEPEELKPEPVFEFDNDAVRKTSKRKAKESIKKLVKEVIRKDEWYMSPFVQDKMDQDAEQLGNLYYQQECIDTMLKANMQSVGQGNISPRMFETFTQMSKNYSDITAQISQFQISIRENYAKIKFDMMEDGDTGFNGAALPGNVNNDQQASLESQNIFIGTKSLVDNVQAAKKRHLKEMQEKAQKPKQPTEQALFEEVT